MTTKTFDLKATPNFKKGTKLFFLLFNSSEHKWTRAANLNQFSLWLRGVKWYCRIVQLHSGVYTAWYNLEEGNIVTPQFCNHWMHDKKKLKKKVEAAKLFPNSSSPTHRESPFIIVWPLHLKSHRCKLSLQDIKIFLHIKHSTITHLVMLTCTCIAKIFTDIPLPILIILFSNIADKLVNTQHNQTRTIKR